MLTVRLAIVSSELCFDKDLVILQWTNFLDSAVVLFPILVYTYTKVPNEDCFQCFNRHQSVLFSLYQTRMYNNSIEASTLKCTAFNVLQHHLSVGDSEVDNVGS